MQFFLLFVYLFLSMLIPRKEGVAPFLNCRSVPAPCQHRRLHLSGFRLLCPGASDAGGERTLPISRNFGLCAAPITALAACPTSLQADFALLPSPTLVSPVEKKNPDFGTHPDIRVLEASPATFPEVIRKFLFATTTPQGPFCLVLPVSDCPRVPVYENWASLRDRRCRDAWWHPHELVGVGGGLGWAMGLVGKQLESP